MRRDDKDDSWKSLAAKKSTLIWPSLVGAEGGSFGVVCKPRRLDDVTEFFKTVSPIDPVFEAELQGSTQFIVIAPGRPQLGDMKFTVSVIAMDVASTPSDTQRTQSTFA